MMLINSPAMRESLTMWFNNSHLPQRKIYHIQMRTTGQTKNIKAGQFEEACKICGCQPHCKGQCYVTVTDK